MRPFIGWVVRGAAIVAAFLTTVQPVLGSFSLFRASDPIDYTTIHLVMGGILYNCALLLSVLSPFTTFRRRWHLFGISIVQYGLTHAQLLLGLRSNDDGGLLAFHIPMGVLIFFIAYLSVALTFGASVNHRQA